MLFKVMVGCVVQPRLEINSGHKKCILRKGRNVLMDTLKTTWILQRFGRRVIRKEGICLESFVLNKLSLLLFILYCIVDLTLYAAVASLYQWLGTPIDLTYSKPLHKGTV